MKALAVILAVVLVTACSGMRSSGSSGGSGASGTSDSDYRYGRFNDSGASLINRHDDPRDLYFGG